MAFGAHESGYLQCMYFMVRGAQTCERGAGADDHGGIHQVQEVYEGVRNGVRVLAESSVRVAVIYPHVDEAGRDVFVLRSFRTVARHAFAVNGRSTRWGGHKRSYAVYSYTRSTAIASNVQQRPALTASEQDTLAVEAFDRNM